MQKKLHLSLLTINRPGWKAEGLKKVLASFAPAGISQLRLETPSPELLYTLVLAEEKIEKVITISFPKPADILDCLAQVKRTKAFRFHLNKLWESRRLYWKTSSLEIREKDVTALESIGFPILWEVFPEEERKGIRMISLLDQFVVSFSHSLAVEDSSYLKHYLEKTSIERIHPCIKLCASKSFSSICGAGLDSMGILGNKVSRCPYLPVDTMGGRSVEQIVRGLSRLGERVSFLNCPLTVSYAAISSTRKAGT